MKGLALGLGLSPSKTHTVSGGGGGGVPEWVPDNAKIHIDLVGDRAWTEADGIVAVDTLLGSDPNTASGWGATIYEPELLTSNGYTRGDFPHTAVVAAIGAARAMLLAGSTAVFRFAGDQGQLNYVLVSADGNAAVEIDVSQASAHNVEGSSWAGSYSVNVPNLINGIEGNSLIKSAVAITLTPARAEFAACGISPAQADSLTTDDFPVSGDSPLVAVVFDIGTIAMQSITIYDPLPDTTGLSALSETGVTNTAPTDLVYDGTRVDLFTTLVDPTTVSIAVGDVTNETNYPPDTGWVFVLATDAEGNPLTYSMINAGSGEVALDADQANHPGLIVITQDPVFEPGEYLFTLRATDPGGLYVEQEFTITVTA